MTLYSVEGCSGSGKSTWIRDSLDKKLGSSPIRYDRYYGKGVEPRAPEYRLGVFRALMDLAHETDIVIDRMHWSEAWFGSLLRDCSSSWQDLETFMLMCNVPVKVFYINTPVDECERRLLMRANGNDRDRRVVDHLNQEWAFLDMCARTSKLDVEAILG